MLLFPDDVGRAQAASLSRPIQTGEIVARLYLQKEGILAAITSGVPHVISGPATRASEQWRQTMRALKKGKGGQYLDKAEASADEYFQTRTPRLDDNVTNLMMKVVKDLLTKSNGRLSGL